MKKLKLAAGALCLLLAAASFSYTPLKPTALGGLYEAQFGVNLLLREAGAEQFLDNLPSPDEIDKRNVPDMEKVAKDVLLLPTVGDKSFLITIGDRSVGGLTWATPSMASSSATFSSRSARSSSTTR